MRLLVTGSAGRIGPWCVRALREAGHEVTTFDRPAQPHGAVGHHIVGDIRDISAVRQALQGMDAVVHLAALASDRRGAPEEVLQVNVQGTWNVLLGCIEAGVNRIVNYSSVNALGAVGGHHTPLQFPIDDFYPRTPMTPYQLSKHMGEEMCRGFGAKHGLTTISLRPGFVTLPEDYLYWKNTPRNNPEHARHEFWAYVDVRDVVAATLLSLTLENVPNDAFLLMAKDTYMELPTLEMLVRFFPEVPWYIQNPEDYFAADPFRSIMDCSHAKEVLGWEAKHSWREAL